MIRSILNGLVLLGGVVLMPTAAAAQSTGPGLHVIPRAGVFFAGYHFTTYERFHYRFQPAPIYGLVGDYRFRGSPWGVRVDATQTHARLFGPGIFDFDRNGPDENRILTVSVDGVYRIPISRGPLRPYLLAGAGLKRHDMKAEFASADVVFGFAKSQTNLALHLGGGLDVWLGPVALNAEIGSYTSTFDVDANNQDLWLNDMVAALGLRIALPKATQAQPR